MEPEPFVGDQVNKLEPTFRQKTDLKKKVDAEYEKFVNLKKKIFLL